LPCFDIYGRDVRLDAIDIDRGGSRMADGITEIRGLSAYPPVIFFLDGGAGSVDFPPLVASVDSQIWICFHTE